jgi:hypothetical protein
MRLRDALRQVLPDDVRYWLRTVHDHRRLVARGRFNLGYCVICERRTMFVWEEASLREHYRCVRCDSIPRWRAAIHVLNLCYPAWRDLSIFESSPGGMGSGKLKRECARYIPSHFWPGMKLGAVFQGIRCEDLTRLTFPDDSFDLVVTQDVFEHVLQPDRAFSEVARILRPGGSHVFTVPFVRGHATFVRAEMTPVGLHHLAPPNYHRNPIDNEGTLVVTEWGDDLVDFIRRHSCLDTEVYDIHDRRLGLDGESLEVFVSRKTGPLMAGISR